MHAYTHVYAYIYTHIHTHVDAHVYVHVHKQVLHIKAIKVAIDKLCVSADLNNLRGASTELAASPNENASQKGSQKKYGAFMTHHKADCAMEARFLKSELEKAMDAAIFLDSDDLHNLSELFQHVRVSDGHSYTGHNYTSHKYTGHNYTSHNYTGHNYTSYNYIGPRL